MAKLQPCRRCQRHVRIDEDTCPFCSTRFEAKRPSSLPVGRLARAAVFSWAIAGGIACGDDAGPSFDASTTTDAPVLAVDAGHSDAAVDGGTSPDATPSDAAVTDAPVADAFIPMPYGAPPVRTRLV